MLVIDGFKRMIMRNISNQLQYEDWAYKNGYENEVQITLVADFLNGVYAPMHENYISLAVLPFGIHLSKPIREAFYRSGQELANLKSNIAESDIITALYSFVP